MYGTVARFLVKETMGQAFQAYITKEANTVKAQGELGSYVYQMDSNSREFYLVVLFETRTAYQANAQSPEQHQRYLELMQYMEAEPEWHDGEIVAGNS